MKNFASQYLDQLQIPKNTDPYLFTTPEVREEMLQMQGQSLSIVNSAHIATLFLTAPLTTITASLQLSVKPHKRIYEQPLSQSKEIMRTNTALTLQEKRKMELMIRTGGQQRPYTAPVYEGYQAVIRGLSNQGWKAFFKGFLFRTMHQLSHLYAFYEVSLAKSNSAGLAEQLSLAWQLVKMWGLQLACDTSLNALHIAQNRYILQNNIPEFRVFRNGSKVIRKMFTRKEVFTAASYHIFNSFAEVFLKYPLYLTLCQKINTDQLGILYLIEIVMYPFNTAFRRLTCQHSSIPGMIPLRYKGLWHALRLIPTEQGIKGLYKGFGLYHVTMAVRLACLNQLAPFFLGQSLKE